MPSVHRPSKADQELITELAKAGFPGVSPRTLESWRNEGLLPRPQRRGLGQGLGSTSTYPPEAVRQVIKLASILRRHRNFDKAAVLLHLHGYEVEPERIRHALLAGIDYMDRKVAAVAGEETDPTKIADAMAEAYVSERLRSKEEREFRKQQIREAGGRENLRKAYASLFRLYFGGTSVGGFLAAQALMGQDFRNALDLDEKAFQRFEMGLDSVMSGLTREGGFGEMLRTSIESAPPNGVVGLREFLREVRAWVGSLGFAYSPPGFYGDANEALLHPDIDDDDREVSPSVDDP
jgi:DNA-binding transcriptional MerR regulator